MTTPESVTLTILLLQAQQPQEVEVTTVGHMSFLPYQLGDRDVVLEEWRGAFLEEQIPHFPKPVLVSWERALVL